MVTPQTYANHVAMHRAIDAAVALKKRGMGGSGLLVLLIIARHANREGECWLTHDTIGEESATSRWTSMRATKDLAEAGLISIGEHQSGANLYRLLVEDCNQVVADSHVADCTRSVAESNTLVADSYSLSSNLRPEVVPEVVKEVVKGSSTLTSSGQGGGKMGLGSRQFDFAPKTKNKQQQEHYPSTTKPQPETIKDTPEAKLASRYLELLGLPPAHLEASATVWPGLFRRVLSEYPLDDLSAAIEWAFLEDQFWPQHLFRRKGDPVQYLVEKVDSIMTSWRMQQQKQRNSKNQTPATTLTLSQQKVADMFIIT
jgi:hypothetical protein